MEAQFKFGPLDEFGLVGSRFSGSQGSLSEGPLLQASQSSRGYAQPGFLDTLAVAYAATGDFPKAIETAEKALQLIVDNEELTQEIQEHIDLYKANKPVRNK